MSEDYLHACQRAELLGEPKPSEEEWLASKKSDNDDEMNEADEEVIQGLGQSDNGMRRIGGGLEELNSILSVTQKKINRFKNVCGSLGQLLKGRITPRSGIPDPNQQESDPDGNDVGPNEPSDESTILETTNDQVDINQDQNIDESKTISSAKKQEINHKIGSHIDKLDSLITKAENAQYSMQHQTKQMKKIIKK
ncbi:uncharacterized protein [Chelonus insularis]|uniref:uncharacterized protein n=1 Tax=Chelonus insularis TaxID=460826 RepID=UPI001588478C|nr:uncharacterized protein LOC118069411 [Chelonus insularis]